MMSRLAPQAHEDILNDLEGGTTFRQNAQDHSEKCWRATVVEFAERGLVVFRNPGPQYPRRRFLSHCHQEGFRRRAANLSPGGGC
jgi:hypothetical protein